MQQQTLERGRVYLCEREKLSETEEDRERDRERAASPGSAILTICESLEAHLTAVFAKASHSPCPHLYHIDCTRPEALHACGVCLASQDGRVNLCMVLKGATKTGSRVRDDLMKLCQWEGVKPHS